MLKITGRVYLRDVAYSKIKDLIIRDKLNSQVVSENDFASQLNMSRTPIREALKKLQNEDFLEIYPQKGIYIKEMLVEEAQDLMDVRLAIELFSMDTIHDVFRASDLEILQQKIKEQEIAVEEGDIYEFIKLDLSYHEYLLKITGNQYFVKTLNNVNDRIFRHGMRIFKRNMSHMKKSIEDHKLINQYLGNGDFLEARTVMEEHIKRGKRQYLLK